MDMGGGMLQRNAFISAGIAIERGSLVGPIRANWKRSV